MDTAVFGLIVADLIAEPMDLRHPPAPGGLAHLRSLSLHPGGNVCNVAMAMAKFGMSAAACGLVGSDDLGRALIERLGSAGVDTAAVHTVDNSQTSSTVVAVEPGGERCFFHAPGVTPMLDAKAFRACFPVFAQCQWIQIGYFGLLPALTPVLPQLLVELRAAAPKLKISLDTVNPPAAAEQLWPILPHVDLFAPSRPEASALTGESDPSAMAKAFRKHMRPDALLAIKLDAAGCHLEQDSKATHVTAFPITVVDTTGAGDTWFAGLLTGLIRGMSAATAAKFANRAAADCCTAIGASAGVKSFEETVNRIE